MTKTHRAFCENLKAVRVERGLTQAELAKAMGISQPRLAELEKGLFSPRLTSIERAATALRCRVVDLLDPEFALASA